MLEYGFMAPTMFGGLIVFLLFGFPVAFSLRCLGRRRRDARLRCAGAHAQLLIR